MDNRGLCPTGWHVPTDGEWTILESFLGGPSVAGGSLKSTATQPTPGGWNGQNTGATNSSGFTAISGGFRYTWQGGGFSDIGDYGYWWSSSPFGSFAWFRFLNKTNIFIGRTYENRFVGMSVRCLKD
jgi:uncharacterized protein (TIGR02145 family)